jgi:predicted DNA-binding antitoxin AbrB/MazE fold protein
MKTTVEAIFEDGVFKPVKPPELTEGQRVEITVERVAPLAKDDILRIARDVYRGLSASDIEDLEQLAHHRVFITRPSNASVQSPSGHHHPLGDHERERGPGASSERVSVRERYVPLKGTDASG